MHPPDSNNDNKIHAPSALASPRTFSQFLFGAIDVGDELIEVFRSVVIDREEFRRNLREKSEMLHSGAQWDATTISWFVRPELISNISTL